MNKKDRARIVLQKLMENYPEVSCDLIFKNPYELIVAVILSAQCTDKRVNMVTPELFAKYPTPFDLADADIEVVKKLIYSTGFYNNKAKNIIGCAKGIAERFHGNVPDNMDDLLTLPGVARKTANVVLGVAFSKSEGIAVDTHLIRLTRLLGLTENDKPEKIEKDLMSLFPREKWSYVSLALVRYGRRVCPATKHDVSGCWLGGHGELAINDY